MNLLRNSPLKDLYFKKKDYFNNYLSTDLRINKNFLNLKPSHYFNDILYTKWPLYISVAVFFMLFYFVMALKRFTIAISLSFVSLGLVLYYVFCWFSDMILESLVFGRYNRKVRAALAYGFMLFLVSEVFIFSGFFWAYFDRLFDPSTLTGGTSLPYGLEPLFKSFKPIYATLVLVVSGYFANWGIYYTHLGSLSDAYWYAYLSVVCGVIFLLVQISEYNSLLFSIADSVYASSFYFLTGFHGLHVTIGLLFLAVQQDRMFRCQFNKARLQGYRLAVIYWHFVDYIWIFLFLAVYVVNWNYSYYYMWY